MRTMKLQDYLSQNNLSVQQFAAQVGLKRRATVYEWLRGDCVPVNYMPRIIEATHGQVTANDFYDLPNKEGA